MADTLEQRLRREYQEYSRMERAGGREPLAEHRWQVRRLDEMEREEATPKPKTTKKAAKRGDRPGYLKYRSNRISQGKSYMSYDQWLQSRGG